MLISTTRGRCIKRRKSPRVLGMSNEWHQSKQSTVTGGRWRRSCGDPSLSTHLCDWLWPLAEAALSHPPLFSPHLSSCGVRLFRLHWNMTRFSQWIWIIFSPYICNVAGRRWVRQQDPKEETGKSRSVRCHCFQRWEMLRFCLFVFCFQREMCVLIYYSFEVYF